MTTAMGSDQLAVTIAIRQALLNEGYEWVVDIDIEQFFDKVNHDKLIQILREQEMTATKSDPEILESRSNGKRVGESDNHGRATRRTTFRRVFQCLPSTANI